MAIHQVSNVIYLPVTAGSTGGSAKRRRTKIDPVAAMTWGAIFAGVPFFWCGIALLLCRLG